MTYFTSWDINVFLCLVALGLPEDLVKEWISRIRIEDRNFCLDRDRFYHHCRWIPLERFRKSLSYGYSLYFSVLMEFNSIVEDTEPEDRYEYFEWAYEFHYHHWYPKDLEWVKGFHPGRFLLMDHKRNVILEEIRDLEILGAWQEEKFIRKQKHIDEYLTNLQFK